MMRYKNICRSSTKIHEGTSYSALLILIYIIFLVYALCISKSVATANSPSDGISFSNHWEQGITGPGLWSYVQVVDNNRFQMVTSPVRYGYYPVRIEVRPGDDPIQSSGERAEVQYMSDANGNFINENESSGTQYYAFSVQLDPNWQPPEQGDTAPWGIIFQLHGPDSLGVSPSFAIEATDKFGVELTSGDLDSPSGSYEAYQQFSDSRLNIGHWIDFIVKIKFAKDFTGSVDIWRRDEGKYPFTQVLSINNIPTLQYRSSQGGVGDHYWKYGYYRSKQTTVTSILLLGGMTRGTTFDNVVATAFPLIQGQRIYLPSIWK